jgi:pimeloyl-ACP methyl ester carboxylesterase
VKLNTVLLPSQFISFDLTAIVSVKFLLGVFVVLVLVLVLAGAAYQAIGTVRDAYKYPPPGKLVDVGGYRLHIYCTGECPSEGSPTVVMDFGLGGWSSTWNLVQAEVAKFTRVCAYDRAGYAWSDPSPTPRTSQQIVKELHTLLTNAGIEDPYVLVGHSFSGLSARLFASQYPDEVVGIVLVDAINENMYSRPFPEFQKIMARNLQMFRILSLISQLGILRLFIQLVGNKAAPDFVRKLPSEIQPMVLAKFLGKTFDAAAAETESMERSAAQVSAIDLPNDIPLMVLSHGIPDMFSGLSAKELERAEQTWQELQAEIASLSSKSTLLVAEKSGHFVPMDQPNLAIDAIRQVVEAARQR